MTSQRHRHCIAALLSHSYGIDLASFWTTGFPIIAFTFDSYFLCYSLRFHLRARLKPLALMRDKTILKYSPKTHPETLYDLESLICFLDVISPIVIQPL